MRAGRNVNTIRDIYGGENVLVVIDGPARDITILCEKAGAKILFVLRISKEISYHF